MSDLFAPAPTDNLLPYDGKVNDLGIVIDYPSALYYALLTTLLGNLISSLYLVRRTSPLGK